MSLTHLDDRPASLLAASPVVWEYRVLDLHNLDLATFELQLTHAGLEGWELVCTTHASQAAVLKRPAPASHSYPCTV
jgi:hypothetical protein